MMRGGRRSQPHHAGYFFFICCMLCFAATHAWMTAGIHNSRLSSTLRQSKDDTEKSSTTLDFISLDDAKSSSKFGDFIPLSKPEDPMDTTQQGEGILTSQNLSTKNNDSSDEMEIIKKNKLRNVIIAVSSFAFAIANYVWQLTHPVTAVSILVSMENKSAPLTSIGNNGKPTVIDFWAPWCSNCKVAAPTLQAVEKQYGDSVNFIMINGDDGKNWPLIQLFGVDAIPHLALLSDEGDVETALIGPMSRNVLRADIDALLTKRENCEAASVCHEELPYKMYDAFSNRESRNINFQRAMDEIERSRAMSGSQQ
eukprot:scaffold2408_cov123-Skeletonema_dohrnii-CCMP3373.AAC.5